jgi:PilZ domain-containing protein
VTFRRLAVTPTTAERRSHARFQRQFEIEGPQEGRGTQARMVASDLSMGGLHCSSSRDYPEMTRLAVRLMLPNGSRVEALDVEAVVVHRRELASTSGAARFELGLFFTGLSDDSRTRLARFLSD